MPAVARSRGGQAELTSLEPHTYLHRKSIVSKERGRSSTSSSFATGGHISRSFARSLAPP